ncbi:FAD-dependent oxidoreductase, partial [Burkholderia pseudomallei]
TDSPGRVATLSENHALPTSHGALFRYQPLVALAATFPWLAVDDLAGGCLGERGEGWFDGFGLVLALRKMARALGAQYV